MKVSKIFSCVLGLHVCIIAVLIVQPGCQSSQPPTQTSPSANTYRQDSTLSRPLSSSVEGARRTSDGLIPATRVGPSDGLDSAFNAGISSGGEFSEFDSVAPLEPLPAGQTVSIAGPSYETYTVKKGDNLWSIAKRYDVSLNELYAANGLNKNSVLRIGQQIQIPVEGSVATVNMVSPDTYQPTGYNQSTTSYTVQRGDTLSRIANQFDTSVGAIKAANGKRSDLIRVGETLVIPVEGSTSAPVVAPVVAPVAAIGPPTPTVSVSANRTHTVKAGEYPATIARQYGMTTNELLAINGITDPRKLQVGQVLKVSGSGSAENVDSRTETVVAPAPAAPAPAVSPAAPAPAAPPMAGGGPIEITVVEADPLIEGEMTEIESDDLFDNAVEIPVIRLEEE